MAKHTVKEDTLYYKSMRLTNAQLVVEVREASPERPQLVTIFHSPAKWDQDRFQIQLKNRTELKEYIIMLQDFDERFGHLLDATQKAEVKSV